MIKNPQTGSTHGYGRHGEPPDTCNTGYPPLAASSFHDYFLIFGQRIPQVNHNFIWWKNKKQSMQKKTARSRYTKVGLHGNLVLGHFWIKSWTFFRNPSFKDMNLRICSGMWEIGFKWMSIYTWNSMIFTLLTLNLVVRINCPNISKSNSSSRTI